MTVQIDESWLVPFLVTVYALVGLFVGRWYFRHTERKLHPYSVVTRNENAAWCAFVGLFAWPAVAAIAAIVLVTRLRNEPNEGEKK